MVNIYKVSTDLSTKLSQIFNESRDWALFDWKGDHVFLLHRRCYHSPRVHRIQNKSLDIV